MLPSSGIVLHTGYGNLAPVTPGGRTFCVIYAVLGIPLFLVAITVIGQQTNRFVDWCLARPRCVDKCVTNYDDGSVSCVSQIPDGCRNLVPTIITGVVSVALYFLIPAAIFHCIEGWSYGEGVYYCFITLLTIGFGDYVAGGHFYLY